MSKERWTNLFYRDGTLKYTGFINEKDEPHGAGTQFYRDGKAYKEGLWGKKGLLFGREYYPNGIVRFEGVYHINTGYGPNWPEYGKAFDPEGDLLYEGVFKVSKSGLGWPTVKEPEKFGKVIQDDDPADEQLPPVKRYRDPAQIRSYEEFKQTVYETYKQSYGKYRRADEAEPALSAEEEEIRLEYKAYTAVPWLEDLEEEALFHYHAGLAAACLSMTI